MTNYRLRRQNKGVRGLTHSEKLVAAALSAQIGPNDQVLTSIRFSDSNQGDVEVDFLVLLAGFGIAALEVKGGQVSFEEGQWWLTDANRRRRIDPIAQARNGKHATRRFLDRQPQWRHGLPNTEWFLAFPFTKVSGDMGPEGRKDLIFANGELDGIVSRMRATLAASNSDDHRLDETSLPLAAALLEGKSGGKVESPKRLGALVPLSIGAVAAAIGLATHSAADSLLITGGVGLASVGALAFGISNLKRNELNRGFTIGVAALGFVFGGLAAGGAAPVSPSNNACDPNYSGCVPIKADVNCDEVTGSVNVIGQDIYRLDRDGDGVGCEWNENSNQSG